VVFVIALKILFKMHCFISHQFFLTICESVKIQITILFRGPDSCRSCTSRALLTQKQTMWDGTQYQMWDELIHNIIVNKSGNVDFSRMRLIKQTQVHKEGCSLDPSRSWPCFGGPATPSYPPPWLLQQLFPKPPLAFSQQCSISP